MKWMNWNGCRRNRSLSNIYLQGRGKARKTFKQYMCWDSKRALLKIKWQTSPLESTCSGLDELQKDVIEAPGEWQQQLRSRNVLDETDEDLEHTKIMGAQRFGLEPRTAPLMRIHHAKRLDQFHSAKSHNNLN